MRISPLSRNSKPPTPTHMKKQNIRETLRNDFANGIISKQEYERLEQELPSIDGAPEAPQGLDPRRPAAHPQPSPQTGKKVIPYNWSAYPEQVQILAAERDAIKAHAERLAEAARQAVAKMQAAGIGFGETELREALAQWERAKQ